MNKLTSGWGW